MISPDLITSNRGSSIKENNYIAVYQAPKTNRIPIFMNF